MCGCADWWICGFTGAYLKLLLRLRLRLKKELQYLAVAFILMDFQIEKRVQKICLIGILDPFLWCWQQGDHILALPLILLSQFLCKTLQAIIHFNNSIYDILFCFFKHVKYRVFDLTSL